MILQKNIINIAAVDEEKIIQKATDILRHGGVIIYPTETCYGIGADATNPDAVGKVLGFKGNRNGKPIAIAVADEDMADKYVIRNDTAKKLYHEFLPGPMSVISKSKGKVDVNIDQNGQTLGVRIPDYPLIRKIIAAFGKPITTTSANSSGKKTPYSLQDIEKYTTQKRINLIELFLDAGVLPFRSPSTVVDTTLDEVSIVRQGEIILDSENMFLSQSEEETQEFAQKIFQEFRKEAKGKALIFALQGDLGAGKTRFAKGIAKALNIDKTITSPTFPIVCEYEYDSGRFFHIDAWRLEDGKELLDFRFSEMISSKNVVVIEWLQKVKNILENLSKEECVLIWVTIEHVTETQRKLCFKRAF